MKFHRSLLAAVAAASPSFAQESDTFDPVVVTATRQEAQLSETLAPVVVITRAEIERSGAYDIAELLRLHAGLDVARSGGHGQNVSVFIRGAESNHTLVLVDGVRINPGTIGGAAFQNLSPEMVERIEIVKGPRSSQWGSDAIGGVVHIITRRPSPGTTGDAHVSSGSHETWNGGFGLSHAGDAVEGSLRLDAFDTRGFPARRDSDQDTGHERLSTAASLAGSLGQASIAARHWQAEGRTDYLDFSLQRVDQDFRNSASALDLWVPAGPLALTAAVTHAVDQTEQNQSGDYALTRRSGLEVRAAWADPTLGVQVGAQGYREEADSSVFGTRFDVRTDVAAVFAQAEGSVAPHHAVLAVRHTEHESFGGHTTGGLEYGFDAWSGGRLVAAAGTGFRAPDATDRFGFGGDPELEPEESVNLELGLRQQVGEHGLSIAVFENRIEELIEFVCSDAFCFVGQNRNVAEARIRGIEAAWRWRPEPWWLRVDAIVQDPVDRTTGERLARRAGKTVAASLGRRFGPFEWATDLLAQGRREDSAFSTTVNPGYAIWNVGLGWTPRPALRLQLRGENVLDREYETAAGFASAGRTAYLTLRYVLR